MKMKMKRFDSYWTKFSRYVYSLILVVLSIPIGYAQVGINTDTPDFDTDITLGSNNKGFLPNRVELRAFDDPFPLSSNIKEGTIVYNTTSTPPISEGLYFWQDDSWNFLRSSNTKRQDFTLASFKETGDDDIYTVPYGKDIDMTVLGSNFTIPRDGNIVIRAVIYVKSVTTKSIANPSIGNTFFRFQITDLTADTVVSEFVAACTPISFPTVSGSGAAVNNNPYSATAINSLEVKEDHEYEVKVFAQEGWNNDLTITAGTYKWRTYQANSVVQVDFISDPY